MKVVDGGIAFTREDFETLLQFALAADLVIINAGMPTLKKIFNKAGLTHKEINSLTDGITFIEDFMKCYDQAEEASSGPMEIQVKETKIN